MSLTLTDVAINRERHTLRAVYEIQCQDTTGRTTLTEVVGFTFNQLNGEVTADLSVADLTAQKTVEEAQIKLADWLERLAEELRKPRVELANIPLWK